MRLRLASLALLLLALCRSAVSDSSPWVQSSNIQTSDSTVGVSDGTQKATFKKFSVVPDAEAEAKQAKLAEDMSNTLVALIMKEQDTYKDAPAYFKNALNNGVLCEVEDALEAKIITALYGGAAGFTADIQTKEKEKAKADPKIGISCETAAGKTPDDCLCVKNKPLLFCLATNLKKEILAGSVTKKKCLKPALDELKTKGRKALAEKMEKFEMESFFVEDQSNPLKGFTEPATKADVLCDGLNAEVIPLVEQAYASDAVFWFRDALTIAKLAEVDDLDKACAKEETKKNPIAKCMCEKKMGVLPCVAQTAGKIFKDAGFLDCAPTPAKFDETKKVAAAQEFMKAMGAGEAPQPGGPTGAPPAGGNETTTAAPSDGAATSSLLLAPLAAAAAALLLL